MDLGIRGKRALVAASSLGLGRAIADELAAAGCDLVICSRDRGRIDAAAESIVRDHGAKVIALTADLTSAEGAESLAERALEALSGIDILVTNNGGPPAGEFEAHDLPAWTAAYRRTFESALVLTRRSLPGMKERGWGRILNVTSIAAKQPVDGLILSNSMRAAVTGMARTLANEVAPFGVTVNNLMPGYTRTERLGELGERLAQAEGLPVEDVFARWASEIPAGRIGDPAEFAALAAFLASARASYITGQSIAVDGGWIRSLL